MATLREMLATRPIRKAKTRSVVAQWLDENKDALELVDTWLEMYDAHESHWSTADVRLELINSYNMPEYTIGQFRHYTANRRGLK
jgi:hypothetical protein